MTLICCIQSRADKVKGHVPHAEVTTCTRCVVLGRTVLVQKVGIDLAAFYHSQDTAFAKLNYKQFFICSRVSLFLKNCQILYNTTLLNKLLISP